MQVDKTNLKCRFQDSGNATNIILETDAGYQYSNQEVSVSCDIPSHTAGTVDVFLSLDGGQTFLSGSPTPTPGTPGTELTYTSCAIGEVAESIYHACAACIEGTFSNSSAATTCTACPTG